MLRRNPIPCAGRQIQKAPGIIAKDILNWGILRWIEHNTCDMEPERFPLGIHDQHFVADVEVAETPEHRRVSTGAIQVSRNHRAAPFAWTRACTVPADIVPGSLLG